VPNSPPGGRVAGRKRKTPSRKDKGSQLPSDKAVVDVESVSAQVSNAHDIIDLLDSSDDEGQTPASTAGTPSLSQVYYGIILIQTKS